MTMRKRRRQEVQHLEDMTSEDLVSIYFFGNIQPNPHTVTFTATPEQQHQAGEILTARGVFDR